MMVGDSDRDVLGSDFVGLVLGDSDGDNDESLGIAIVGDVVDSDGILVGDLDGDLDGSSLGEKDGCSVVVGELVGVLVVADSVGNLVVGATDGVEVNS